jgi:ubiquitin carboxyl-terminal hydrolase L5
LLGVCDPESWLEIIAPVLEDRMQDTIEFSLLALVRDPLTIAIDHLAYSIVLNTAIEAKLKTITTEWKTFAEPLDERFIFGSSDEYSITEELLQKITLSQADQKKVEVYDEADGLLHYRSRKAIEQNGLRKVVQDEIKNREAEDDKARERRNDYGPVVQRWFMMLSENSILRELHEEISSK